MRVSGFWRPWTTAGVIGCALVMGTTALESVASPAAQASPTRQSAAPARQPAAAGRLPAEAVRQPAAAGRQPAATGHVSPTPANGTPALAPTGATTEQVRQIVQCGGTMYAVGTFTKIDWGGKPYSRRNAFSFGATAPYRITSWNPDVNGEVNSVALTPDCSQAWLGGSFTKVAGTPVDNIAKVSASSGAVVKSWPHSANKVVNSILFPGNGHLLVGGAFTSINGSNRSFYASLNPSTGRDDGYLNLTISGHYVYPGAGGNSTDVYKQELSPRHDHVLVEGVFTSVGGQPRQQIFMLNLGAGHGTVSGWNSSEFSRHCGITHPFYVKAAAWSPDQSTVYIATTGFRPFNWNHTFPLTGLCDVAAAFPATQTGGLHHKWINYTGCDSLYAAAADGSTVYVGGHERWAYNARQCNKAGPGSIPAPGMGGFTPGGSLLTNSSGTQGRYSRGRGIGADDMLRTSAGLWIASDNFEGTNTCGGVSGHAGICFLPN